MDRHQSVKLDYESLFSKKKPLTKSDAKEPKHGARKPLSREEIFPPIQNSQKLHKNFLESSQKRKQDSSIRTEWFSIFKPFTNAVIPPAKPEIRKDKNNIAGK